MLRIKRTNSESTSFRKLNTELDKELAILDGKDHSFYAQYNKIDSIHHVLGLFTFCGLPCLDCAYHVAVPVFKNVHAIQGKEQRQMVAELFVIILIKLT